MENSHFIRTTQVNQTKRNEEDQKLRGEMTTNDKKVDELQTQIRALQNNADVELQTKNKEIQKLNERINELQEENKKLEERLADTERRLIKSEIDNIDMNYEITTLKENIDKLKEQLWTSEEDREILYIAQMCQKIPSLIYKRVNPDHFDQSYPYKVKNIIKDIDDEEQDEDKKDEAKQRWRDLKKEINWDKKYEKAMKSIQATRNMVAHPPLLEKNELRNFAKSLKEKGWIKSKSERNPKVVFDLIDIWERLVETEN